MTVVVLFASKSLRLDAGISFAPSSIKPLPVAADPSEHRAEPPKTASILIQHRPCGWQWSDSSTWGILASFCRAGQSTLGQPWCSPAQMVQLQEQMSSFAEQHRLFRNKMSVSFQIKTLKMYEEQLSHMRKLITVGELFLLRLGQAALISLCSSPVRVSTS